MKLTVQRCKKCRQKFLGMSGAGYCSGCGTSVDIFHRVRRRRRVEREAKAQAKAGNE